MNVDSELTFHITYVPGTVRHLRLFLLSLLQHSRSCRFRLVSNGCSSAENAMLERLCEYDERLELVGVSRRRPLPHGQVLTLLQQRETSETFAFMDSDIFATGDFLSPILERAGRLDAFFSCPALWSTPEYETMGPEFQCLSGAYHQLDDGLCVGNSYFAIYDNECLRDCIRETGVTFNLYTWDQVPAGIRQILSRQGRRKVLYDTGKLLNVLLADRGHHSEFTRLPTLEHVGGISGSTLSEQPRLLDRLHGPVAAHTRRSLRRLLRRVRGRSQWQRELSVVEREWDRVKQARRSATCRHFSSVLQGLCDGSSPSDVFDHDDVELCARVDWAQTRIESMYRRWADRLDESPVARAA